MTLPMLCTEVFQIVIFKLNTVCAASLKNEGALFLVISLHGMFCYKNLFSEITTLRMSIQFVFLLSLNMFGFARIFSF